MKTKQKPNYVINGCNMNQNERREFLRNKDLEMSKQVDKIITEAQPKPPKDIQPLLLKPVYPK